VLLRLKYAGGPSRVRTMIYWVPREPWEIAPPLTNCHQCRPPIHRANSGMFSQWEQPSWVPQLWRVQRRGRKHIHSACQWQDRKFCLQKDFLFRKFWLNRSIQTNLFNTLFMRFLKCQSGSCVAVNEGTDIAQISSKRFSFVFQRWTKVLG